MCFVVVIVIIGDLAAFQRRDCTDTHVDLCRCGAKKHRKSTSKYKP